MRVMYDAVTPANLPAGADLYGGYDDGHWPNAAAIAARFPGKRLIRITVFPADIFGDVLDVEKGDAQPADVPDWLTHRRGRGADPSIYSSTSSIGAVEAACKAARVQFDRQHWWRADYETPPDPTLKYGEVAHQYHDAGGYDLSVVADYWPGIDPPKPSPSLPKGSDMALLVKSSDPADTRLFVWAPATGLRHLAGPELGVVDRPGSGYVTNPGVPEQWAAADIAAILGAK